MKKFSVLFLKSAILLVMIPFIAAGLYGLFWLPGNPVNPRYASMIYPVLAGFYLASVPLLYSGIKLFQLLTYVGKNTLTHEVKAIILKKLKTAAVSAGIIFSLLIPFVFMIAQEDDAPGLIIVSGIPVLFATAAIAIITLFQYSSEVR